MDPDACLKIIHEQLMHVGGDYDTAIEHIEALLDWLNKDGFKPKETMLTEWEDVVVGSYWFFCDYHSGQWSDEYRLSCKAGMIYKPGPCSSGPESDSGEEMVYKALEALFNEANP